MRRSSVRVASLAMAVAAAVAGCSGGSTPKPSVSPSPSVGPSDRPAAMQVWVGGRRGPVGLAVVGDTVWVAESGANRIAAIDATGKVVREVEVGITPLRLVFGGGALWVGNFREGTVSRVDPLAGKVTDEFPVGPGVEGMAFMSGALWVVTQNDGTVRRFDRAGAPAATVKVGNEPRLIAAGASRLWVSVYGDDTVVPIDPATGRAEPAIKVCDGPQGLAEEAGLVWVACTTGEQVAVIDAKTRAVVATRPLQGSPDAVFASGGRVYVLNQVGPVVTSFDPATRAPNGTVLAGDGPSLNDQGNDDLVISGDRVWISRFNRNDVIAVYLP